MLFLIQLNLSLITKYLRILLVPLSSCSILTPPSKEVGLLWHGQFASLNFLIGATGGRVNAQCAFKPGTNGPNTEQYRLI